MWIQHGGSGLGLSFGDVDNLDLDDIEDLYKRLSERRASEARAIEAANKPKRRR